MTQHRTEGLCRTGFGGISAGSGVARRHVMAGAVAGVAGLPVAAARPAGAVHPDGTFARAGDLVVYLAVLPANLVRGHPPEHTGQGAHGETPEGRYVHHLLVALFDERTGARVTDAAVSAIVHGLRHSPEDRVVLGPMAIDGARAFGGFTTLPARDYYRLEIEARRPGSAAPVRAVFPHRHFQP